MTLYSLGRVEAGMITELVNVKFHALTAQSIFPSLPITTREPANDDSFFSSNLIIYPLQVTEPTKAIDLVFGVDQSTGPTEYSFNQTVQNMTDTPWRGIRYLLGFGDGDRFSEAHGTGLDFDWPDRTFASGLKSANFHNLVHGESQIVWSEGLTQAGLAENSAFAIDVPDRPSVPTTAWTDSGYRFTLRVEPISMPTPSSLPVVVLLGMAFSQQRMIRSRSK